DERHEAPGGLETDASRHSRSALVGMAPAKADDEDEDDDRDEEPDGPANGEQEIVEGIDLSRVSRGLLGDELDLEKHGGLALDPALRLVHVEGLRGERVRSLAKENDEPCDSNDRRSARHGENPPDRRGVPAGLRIPCETEEEDLVR